MNDAIAVTGRPDDFLIHGTEEQLTRKNLDEVTDGLSATLRQNGYIRDTYTHSTYLQNLNDTQ